MLNSNSIENSVNTQNMESAATEFQRRFHISADDGEANRRSSVTSQVIYTHSCA